MKLSNCIDQFCEVILKIHLIQDEKIKVKSYENQQNSVSEYTDSFTLMISFVFSL